MFGSTNSPDIDLLDLLQEVLERLAAEDRSGWSDTACSECVIKLTAAAERLQAEVVREVAGWDTRQAWAIDGALSPASWIADHTSLGKQDASALVRTAGLVSRHPATADALASGALTASKAALLAAAVKGRVRLFMRDEDTLLEAAPTLSTDDFAAVAKLWRSYADDEMANRDSNHIHDTRELTFSSTLFGRVTLNGSLDTEGARIVQAALDAYDRPDPLDGVEAPRTVGQRHADALVQICSEAVGRLQEERGVHQVPSVDLVWDQSRNFATSDTDAETPRNLTDLLPRREILDAGPVCSETARRIACDATVRRLVMDGPAEVLELGRASRLVNRAMRRALQHRDGGCVFPGCTAPVSWCDAHHLIHWEDGGPTNLDNLVLLCRRHHVACHEGGWELERDLVEHTVVVVTRGRPTRRREGSRPARQQPRDHTRPPNRGPTEQTPDRRELVPL